MLVLYARFKNVFLLCGLLRALQQKLTASKWFSLIATLVHSKVSAGKTPGEVLELVEARRARQGVPAPNITNIRKAIKGKTYKHGRKETRGRKLKISPKFAKSMNKIRKELCKQALAAHAGTQTRGHAVSFDNPCM